MYFRARTVIPGWLSKLHGSRVRCSLVDVALPKKFIVGIFPWIQKMEVQVMSLERGISQAHRHHFSDKMEACETLHPVTDEGRFRSGVYLMLLAKTDSSIMGLMKVSWSSVAVTDEDYVL